MNRDKREKIARYMKNASKFLWGLPPSPQEKTYWWLRNERKLEFQTGSYSSVLDSLIGSYGVEKILELVVIPEIHKQLTGSQMSKLREYWYAGSLPDMSFLRVNGIDKTNIVQFLEVNNQYEYVERWGELAGLFFEEVEPELSFDRWRPVARGGIG